MTELEYFKGDEFKASTWRKKYAMEGENNPDDMHKRMAREFARVNEDWQSNPKQFDKSKLSSYGQSRNPLDEFSIYNLFKDFRYIIPGGSVMEGLGSNRPISLSNCFVTSGPKDSYEDIMEVRTEQVQLMKRRGGDGYDLSYIRPRGAIVHNAAKSSTGAASFMEVSSALTNEVAQDGRRGALLLSVSIVHPDSEEFITAKQDLSKITGANISVKIPNDFMEAVLSDTYYIQRFPLDLTSTYPEILDIDNHKDAELNTLYPVIVGDETKGFTKKIRARELWNTLMKCAWNTAEPGIMFEGTMHNFSPDGVYPNFRMVSTNPCGEIPMGPYDSCRLIHHNLTSYVTNPFTSKAEFDMDLFYKHSYEAMVIADLLIDLEIEHIDRILTKIEPSYNKNLEYSESIKDFEDIFLPGYSNEFKLWWKIRTTALEGRRTGIGFTGLADTLAMLNIGYSTEEGINTVDSIMRIKFKAELDATIDLAITKDKFRAYDGYREWHSRVNDTAKEGNSQWYEFVRSSFPEQANRMSVYGRRNISWSTVAPTGTVSILAGTSSGIEPVFLPFYERKRKCMSPNDRVDSTDIAGEKYTHFVVVHTGLKNWYDKVGYLYLPIDFNGEGKGLPTSEELTLKDWEYVFPLSPYYGSTSPEINWEKRVKMQGVVQLFTTHSISSTVNLPNSATIEDVNNIYIGAWKEGLKGITVYRDGSREGVLNAVNKPEKIDNTGAPKRPKVLEADYYEVKVKGEQFIVLVGLLNGRPYEVFAFRPLNPVNIKPHRGKITKIKKMHYSYDSEYINISNLQLANKNVEENAATLYSSMLLRHGVDIAYITKTAKKVNDNITSFSSAMCRILSKYIGTQEVKGEVCPDCGGPLVRESGCEYCKECSWSKCL